MAFNVVLVTPQIPNNTGNIGRLCVGTNCTLHLIEPLGFHITDKHLRRAGLDYWPHLKLQRHIDWDAFIESVEGGKLWFFSSNVEHSIWDVEFQENDYLIFGREADGLPEDLLKQYASQSVKIPQYSEHIRSLNLSNAVAISVYEGLRQLSLKE